MLVPRHNSYMDFLLIVYIHYHYQIDIPFTCGPEDMLNIGIITYLLRSGGGFFLNSENMKSDLFKAVFKAYLR